jgi:hypothetical protein
MLSRMEFAVTRHGMLGPKIVALLRSTMACYPYPQEELEREYFGVGLAMISGLERTAQHIGSRRRHPTVPSGPIFSARPNS